MVRQMHESGLCGFGCHSYSNIDFSDFEKVDVMQEVYFADQIFMKELNYAPKDFCFPSGKSSEEAIQRLATEAYYDRLYSLEIGKSYAYNGKLILHLTDISGKASNKTVKNKFR